MSVSLSRTAFESLPIVNSSFVVGVDIGGSHITSALVDLHEKTILPGSIARKSLNSHVDSNLVISAWAQAIKESTADLANLSLKIGIGLPGPFDYEKGICWIKGQDKYDALHGLNVRNLLASELGIEDEDIKLNNDAVCFLQGEAFAGAGKGYSKVIGLTLGTGLGAAVVANGEAKDANLWDSPFKDSIAEDYLSTRWFLKRYKELSGEPVPSVKDLSLLVETDAKAKAVFQEFGSNLGIFLNKFIQTENPEIVVLGGNIANAYHLFENSLKENIDASYLKIPIVKASLGEDATVLGASALWV